ncbi:DUF2690 domain-containing protein [Streptomyces sp. NPDC059913]|uniref:DUF2690 domain-containing protein n=1 Tax=unclassified Streptomyces TaxID=2593676 RepID=UPI00332A2D2F
MRFGKVIGRAAAAATALIALQTGFAGNAGAATLTYDGQDPIAAGCAGDAITAKKVTLTTGTDWSFAELRYSPSCRTAWGRVQVARLTGLEFGWAYVERQSDGNSYRCESVSWSATLGSYTCYTPMINDAGQLARAYGYAKWNGHVFSGVSDWY